MNSEEEILDYCNSNTKKIVNEDSTNIAEEIIPRNSLQVMDGDVGKSVIETEAVKPPTPASINNSCLGEGDGLETDALRGNSVVHCASQTINSDLDISSNAPLRQGESNAASGISQSEFQIGNTGIGEATDVGVDLTLNESGMLELQSLGPEAGQSGDETALNVSGLPSEALLVDDDTNGSSTAINTAASLPCDSSEGEVASSAPAVDENEKHKQGAKRVTFPSDEDIVSGAVEPKDPWRHAQNVTVEEIVAAYKQACQKLNCKPIARLLTQIQELKELNQRSECLDLKGEKLDYKACEALEEIFKRVQFKVVDLEQTNLDEDGASALFDMIEYYESATHLNISFNKHIGTRGWQAAAHMMRKTSSLQYLDARNTPLLDHSAPFVARALRISGSLAVLHLENAGLSGRPLMLLATALKMNMNLRELYLADNKLNGLQDSAQLGNLLKFNYNIQILDLRNNHIMDSGLAYVCEGLKEQRKGLVTLVLWNNQLTHNGMGYLAAALPCTQSLETLNLGHNSVGNEGVHKLKDGLIGNRSVLRLGLASTKLSCEGAVAVAEFIAESPRLLRLDLRENEIKTGGLMALSLALKVNTSLLRLDLDREPKRETVKSFIETQRALLAEIQNGCKRNFILAKEKEETEQKMRLSASMPEITATEMEVEPVAVEPAGESSGVEPVEEVGEEPRAENQEEGSQGQETPGPIMEIDSDTDEEEEGQDDVVEGSVTPSVSETPPASQPSTAAPPQPPLAPSPAPAMGPVSPSAITVSETPAPPGTPPSPGRCISVSSPGRGHKIFMVTRVESPPEQQQQQKLQQNKPASAGPSPAQAPQTQALSPQTQALPPQTQTLSPQTQTLSPQTRTLSPQTQPAAPEMAVVHQSPSELENGPSQVVPGEESPQPVTVEKHWPHKATTPEETEEDTLESLRRQADEGQELSKKTAEPPQVEQNQIQANGEALQPEQSLLQVNVSKLEKEQTVPQISKEGLPVGQGVSKMNSEDLSMEQEQSQTSSDAPQVEQDLLRMNTKALEEDQTSSPSCKDDLLVEQEQVLADQVVLNAEQTLPEVKKDLLELQSNTLEQVEQERAQINTADTQAQEALPQTSSAELQVELELTAEQELRLSKTEELQVEQELNQSNTGDLDMWEDQHVSPEKQLAGAPLPLDQGAGGLERREEPSTTMSESTEQHQLMSLTQEQLFPRDLLPSAAGPSSAQREEAAPELGSMALTHTDGATGVEEGTALPSTLPNGLKPEFAAHLPDSDSPKPGFCISEHVSVSAELSCGQDLEELLRDASLEMGREAP
ncbi:hypothetical protein GJAV_G00051550 [Gymnothorax javanicus]|nr:hypothetical protein GJAV_G00051550 [Gymnothorax javanicus]